SMNNSIQKSGANSFAAVLKTGAAAIALCCSGAAFAQEAPVDDGGLGTIVVTARKQAESLMTVPVTAAAVSSEDLDRNKITSPTSLVTQIAAIRFDETA